MAQSIVPLTSVRHATTVNNFKNLPRYIVYSAYNRCVLNMPQKLGGMLSRTRTFSMHCPEISATFHTATDCQVRPGSFIEDFVPTYIDAPANRISTQIFQSPRLSPLRQN